MSSPTMGWPRVREVQPDLVGAPRPGSALRQRRPPAGIICRCYVAGKTSPKPPPERRRRLKQEACQKPAALTTVSYGISSEPLFGGCAQQRRLLPLQRSQSYIAERMIDLDAAKVSRDPMCLRPSCHGMSVKSISHRDGPRRGR